MFHRSLKLNTPKSENEYHFAFSDMLSLAESPSSISINIIYSNWKFEFSFVLAHTFDQSLTIIQETWVWSLDWENPLEKEMTTHSGILVWKNSMDRGAWMCPTLCDCLDSSPPGSSVHGILHARILECVAISFSRGSSQRRDQTWVSLITGQFFTLWATRETNS